MIFADRQRSLGTIDPFEREMYTGLGCAVENLLQAAPAHGYRAALTLMPTPRQPVHAARIDLTSRALTSPVESFSIWLIPSTARGAQRGELRMAWDTIMLTAEWAVR